MARAKKKASKKASNKTSKKTEGGIYHRPSSELELFSTGCTILNRALGNGWQSNGIIQIFGPSQSAKSLFIAEAIANYDVQFRDQALIRVIDAENAYNDKYLTRLGIPLDRISKPVPGDPEDPRPRTVEEIEIDLDRAADSGKKVLYCVDSWDALTCNEELEGKLTDGGYKMQRAKLTSELMRKHFSKFHSTRMTIMVVSQVRDNINATAFQEKTKTSGGNWQSFYPNQRVKLGLREKISNQRVGVKKAFGQWIDVKIIKNRVVAPENAIRVPVIFNYGIDDLMASLAYLIDNDKCKGLNETTSKDAGKTWAKEIMASTWEIMRRPDEYKDLLKHVNAKALEVWDEIEEAFAPPKGKYV